MPTIRKKNNLKQFIITAAEKRRFDDVIECLKYVEYARDKDDLLTKGAGKLAEDLAAMAEAMAKPLAKRTTEAK